MILIYVCQTFHIISSSKLIFLSLSRYELFLSFSVMLSGILPDFESVVDRKRDKPGRDRERSEKREEKSFHPLVSMLSRPDKRRDEEP